mmetsp:Transcript_3740/g.7157  ORF Transcript_3740/g.7157 Transcript_3740/m.7157 type:complete len:391 (+) Transcript_3740:97-1269(+)
MKSRRGFMYSRSSFTTCSLTRVRSCGYWMSSFSACSQILTSSSKTWSQHLRQGSSRRDTCCRTSISKACSGMKSADRGPLALSMAVRMCSSVRPSHGFMLMMYGPNACVKMKLMRAPPVNSVLVMLSDLDPSMVATTELEYRVSRFNSSPPLDMTAISLSPSCRRTVLVWAMRSWTLAFSSGRTSRMCWSRMAFSIFPRYGVPMRPAMRQYLGWPAMNSSSAFRALPMSFFSRMSCCPRLTTPMYPRFRGTTLPIRTSIASVPLSIRSNFVRTPTVRSPAGSTSRAMARASELARSWLAADTARMMQFFCVMYSMTRSRICTSTSAGWSPTATFVMPGRSTRVKLSTCGEWILSWIGLREIAFPAPASSSVAFTISSRILQNSVNFTLGL